MSTAIETLLQKTMGLDTASIGAPAVERAVRTRLTACGLANERAYLDAVSNSEAELQELIEAVVVPETWFFRDRAAFNAMVRISLEENLPTNSESVLRLLSLPCSTGEEPYSMAMALLEAGFPAERFHLDAIDISREAIAHARRAVYRKNAFRGSDLAFRERHFAVVPEGHRLAGEVRDCVRFAQGNLFDLKVPADGEGYDIVFCRNLLIYFDVAAQRRALDVLARLISGRGYLFVGPAEASLPATAGFTPANITLAFAFRGRQATADAEARPPPAKVPGPVPMTVARRLRRSQRVTDAPAPSPPEALPPSKPSLEAIRNMANEGHLAEAARLCQERARASGATSDLMYLLGVIRDASGNPSGAAECYRKTIYLDPNHADALAHLILLLERQGDVAGAKVLKGRVARLDRLGRT